MATNCDQRRPQTHRTALPNFFHAGFPKSATTWLHRCLHEHPDVFVPDSDALHYFTVHFDQGEKWYAQHYRNYSGERIVGDTTPSYAGFDWSRRRLARFNPDAKILITLRNPIDRAFSHYFHMKQKRGYPARFEEALENKADLFQWLIAFGFYGQHLSDLFQYFDRSQVCVLQYESIRQNPRQFCRQVFDFLGVDSTFVPHSLDQKVNTASRFERRPGRRLGRWLFPKCWTSEYAGGIRPETRKRLKTVFRSDIELLQELLNQDFGHWIEDPEC